MMMMMDTLLHSGVVRDEQRAQQVYSKVWTGAQSSRSMLRGQM